MEIYKFWILKGLKCVKKYYFRFCLPSGNTKLNRIHTQLLATRCHCPFHWLICKLEWSHLVSWNFWCTMANSMGGGGGGCVGVGDSLLPMIDLLYSLWSTMDFSFCDLRFLHFYFPHDLWYWLEGGTAIKLPLTNHFNTPLFILGMFSASPAMNTPVAVPYAHTLQGLPSFPQLPTTLFSTSCLYKF